MPDLATTVYTLIAAVVVLHSLRWCFSPMRAIPTVGGTSLPFLSVFTAIKWARHGRDLIQEGYRKYYGSVFKIAMFDRWLVVVSGPKLVDELRKRPDDELSTEHGLQALIPVQYMVGEETVKDLYHVDIIREKLTRSISSILPDVVDELQLATEEYIPTTKHEWISVNVFQKSREIVARASSRVFVGMHACRNPDYLDLCINFTADIIRDRTLLLLFPKILKPLVSLCAGRSAHTVQRAIPILQPIIDERKRKMGQYREDWADKPNDMLQWIIDESEVRNGTYTSIIERILLTNFAAIHTSSNSITHAIYHIAEHPEYLQPLREEIESIVNEEGWTKTGLGKMWKLDSFLRESQRHNGINIISLSRKAMQDVTLSDGTLIPRGALVVAASTPLHLDNNIYPDAEAFDPFRFAREREREGQSSKHQYVNTSVDYIAFGHGKHACPGRFFAANELKAMLAFMVLNYDIKFGGDGKRPPNMHWGPTIVPAPNAQVLFRKREVSTNVP
ncbi:hypothetical protein BN946_scf185013.g71 [Trametes cinnabarina]|uniref:Cytochrome P450 n=1 Tax=Pycnoporus cinnabarinus TaxID=5643 RepID=A0A060SGX6_PYCCI|nr:hypothetical protein BN946_scf185013.g71 [Trametes cinnabarina]